MTKQTPPLPVLTEFDHICLAYGFLAMGEDYFNTLRKIRDSEKAHGDQLPPERAKTLTQVTATIQNYERVQAMPVPKEPSFQPKRQSCPTCGR